MIISTDKRCRESHESSKGRCRYSQKGNTGNILSHPFKCQ